MARKFYIEDNNPLPEIRFELSQPTGFSEVTDENELKALYIAKYIEREKDGKEFYNDFRSRLYMSILDGTNTPAEAFLIEDHLKELKNNLITGNWLTAQSINASLPLSGIYDQALKDEIQEGIDTYVTENY